jgi:hypothetical protein
MLLKLQLDRLVVLLHVSLPDAAVLVSNREANRASALL